MRRALVLVVVAAVTAAVSARAQSPPAQTQQPPTFRSSVNLVPLTVVVVDRKGNPVTGLSQSDFTVIEDGKPRAIAAFFPQTFAAMQAPESEPAILNRKQTGGVQPQTRRTFLIALGFGRIQYPTNALDGALQFVRERLLPQDLVSVMAFNRATDFTTDHAAILRFLDRYKKDHERVEWDINEYWVHHRYEPLSKPLQTAVDDLFLGPELADPAAPGAKKRDGSVRDSTAMLLGMDEPRDINEKPWEQRVQLGDLTREARYTKFDLPDLMVRSSVLKVYAGFEYLRHVDGQKHLVFMGQTLALRDKDDEKLLARRANDAGVTLHFIRTNGVPPHNISARQDALNFAALSDIQSLQHVTELTGGYYTGVNYADRALDTIDQASRSTYVIGYEPSNPERDGRYRDVVVKVLRPEVTARYRNGYYAGDPMEPLVLAELVTQSRMESALTSDLSAGDIEVTGTAIFEPGGRAAGQVAITVRINASRVAFTRLGLLQSVRLGLSASGLDRRRETLGGTTGRISIDANNDSYLEFTTKGIPFTTRFAVTEKPVSVKIAVYDYGSDRVGTVVLPVK